MIFSCQVEQCTRESWLKFNDSVISSMSNCVSSLLFSLSSPSDSSDSSDSVKFKAHVRNFRFKSVCNCR